MSTLFEGHLYAVSVDERRGTLYIELRCERCDEVHRLLIWDDQLDAIREVARAHADPVMVNVSSLALGRAADIAPAIISALVWQLTHATAHTEERARELARAANTNTKGTDPHV